MGLAVEEGVEDSEVDSGESDLEFGMRSRSLTTMRSSRSNHPRQGCCRRIIPGQSITTSSTGHSKYYVLYSCFGCLIFICRFFSEPLYAGEMRHRFSWVHRSEDHGLLSPVSRAAYGCAVGADDDALLQDELCAWSRQGRDSGRLL